MTSHHPSEIESNAADSVTSSPRSDCPQYDLQSRVRFMCSFGGQILPRPHDNQLRYVGGDTRIVAVHRSSSFSSLLVKLSKLSGYTDITVKYQLPNEDLDALITVTTDEDVENMMEEYDRLVLGGNPKTARLRLFLFTTGGGGGGSTASSISSLLEGSRREHWFFDALNGGSASAASLDRGRSEVSSILSEVPDYLFGLDTMDENREPKLKNRHMLGENVSVSDPGSPAPVVSPSPYCSTSSIPDLPPVKTKIDNPNPGPSVMEQQTQSENHSMTGEQFMTHQPGGYPGNNMWHQYSPETHYVTEPQPQYTNPSPLQPMPVYYVPGPVPGTNVPVQVQRVPVQTVQSPYVQRIPVPMPVSQVPVSYQQHVQNVGQVYAGGMRPVTAVEMMQDGGVSQAVYYGGRNAGMVPGYQPTAYPVGSELQGGGSTEKMMGKMNQPR